MLLVLSITFHCHYYIYMFVCVQLAHFSLGDWKDIPIAHVIIIIKSEVSLYPFLSYFSVVVYLRSVLHHILSLIANRKYHRTHSYHIFPWLCTWEVCYIIFCHLLQIGSITVPILIIFFRGCVPEKFVTSYSVTYCIYIPGKPGFCFRCLFVVIFSCSLWWVQIVGYVLACRSYSFHYHHCANLSEDIELMKCPWAIFYRGCE